MTPIGKKRSRIAIGCQRFRHLKSLEDCHAFGQTVTSLTTSLPQPPPAPSALAKRTHDINVRCFQEVPSSSHPDLSRTPEDALHGARHTETTDDYLVQSNTLDEREATLMRNFVENMALWADATDPYQHFGVEVPLRAMSEPVLRYAIFAFSSRHLDRQKNASSAEALQYHNRCLQLLIPVLSDSENRINEIVLAAIAILRQLEEMDCEDNQFHLTGTTHILNTVSHIGSSGGLGEAAAWLCLREDIQISLTSQQPLRTNLGSFGGSDTFTRTDDYAWANRMVFLLAKLLKVTFDNTMTHPTVLDNLEEEIEHWNTRKPRSFRPIHFVPRGKDLLQRFPEIWMLLPVHVVGVQYYHIAKIVLAFTQSPIPSRTYANLRNSRSIEKTMRRHLLLVLGLAKSNPKAENTLFTARHSLVAWGWALRHKLDQEAAENLLWDMEAKTGWDVAQSVQALRGHWKEEEEEDN
ncbi:hypothetical protein BJX96DRAFT_173445 [Aspergillus floccosus]